MGIWSGPFAFCLIIVTVRGFLLPIEHRAKTPKPCATTTRGHSWSPPSASSASLPNSRGVDHPHSGEPLVVAEQFKTNLGRLGFDKDVQGILRLAKDHNDEFTLSDCAVALLQLGMAALGSEKTRSAVLADQRFQSLWRRAVDLLPLAQGPEISLMLNALDRLRHRPPDAHVTALLHALASKRGAMKGRSVGFILTAMVSLGISPDAAFLRVLYAETSRGFEDDRSNPYTLSAIVRLVGSLPPELRPSAQYMQQLYQAVGSCLSDFTSKDMRRLLYGLSLAFAATPPGLPPPAQLLPGLEQTLARTCRRYSDASLVACVSCLAQLPGVSSSAKTWYPLLAEVQARLPSLTSSRLLDVLRALAVVPDLPPVTNFLHASITDLLLPRCEKEPAEVVTALTYGIFSLQPAWHDRVLVVDRVTRSLEGRMKGVQPHLLSWVINLGRHKFRVSRALLHECAHLLAPSLTDVKPRFYKHLLDSLLRHRLDVPSAFLKGLHVALCQPDLDLDAAGVALLLESLVRVVERSPDPSLPPLVDLLLNQLLPQHVGCMCTQALTRAIQATARLSASGFYVRPSTVQMLGGSVETALHRLQGWSLLICLGGLAKLGHFAASADNQRRELLDGLLVRVEETGLLDAAAVRPSWLALLTSALAELVQQGHASTPAVLRLCPRLSQPLTAVLLPSSSSPEQLAHVFRCYAHLPAVQATPFVSHVALMAAKGAGEDWPVSALCSVLAGLQSLAYDPGQGVMQQMQHGLLHRLRHGSKGGASSRSLGRDVSSRLGAFVVMVRKLGYQPLPELMEWDGLQQQQYQGKQGPEHDEGESDEEEEEEEEEDWHLSLAPGRQTEEGGLVVMESGGSAMGPRDWGQLGGRGRDDHHHEQEKKPKQQDQGSSGFRVVEGGRPKADA